MNHSRLYSDRLNTVIGSLVLVAIAVAYAPSLGGPFVFDDLNAFKGSDYSQPLPTWNSLLHAEHRPVLSLSFLISDSILGSDAFGRRLGNVFIHLVACYLAFKLAIVFAPKQTLQTKWFALSVASLWGIHPLCSQAVAYVIQRAESLMSLFLFALLLVDVKMGATRQRWRVSMLWVLFVLGIYTKTVMISALAVVPLFDRAFLFDSWREVWRQRKFALLLPLAVGIFSSIILLPALIESKTGVGFGGDAPPVHIYLLTQVRSMGQYAMLTVWPSQLSIDRGPHFVTSLNQIIPETFCLAAWCAAALLFWTRFDHGAMEGKKLAFLMIAPLLILAPSSSFVPTADPMFEHRMYAPLLFLVAWLCTVAHHIMSGLGERRRVVLGCLCTLAFALLFARTMVRCDEYSSAPLLWATAIRVDPDNNRAVQNFVGSMQNQNQSQLVEPALEQLIAESTEVNRQADDRSLDVLRMYRAMEWVAQGKVDAAVPELEHVAGIRGPALMSPAELYTYRQRRDYSTRFVNLAIAYRQAGRLPEAYDQIRFALEIDDTPPFGFAIAGYIAQDLRKHAEAVEHWERALELRKEDWPELQADLDRLIQEHPSAVGMN